MKKFCLVVLLPLIFWSCKKQEAPLREGIELGGAVKFGTTPLKSQGTSSLCWIYGMLATIETNRIMMGDSVNLSPDYLARMLLTEEAHRMNLYPQSGGMQLRGTMPMALELLKTYGMVPYDSYHARRGMNFKVLSRKLAVMARSRHGYPFAYDEMENLLDKEMGALPRFAFLYGAEYTPQEFGRSVFRKGEYTFYTSYGHHSFGKPVVLEVPDNRWHHSFMNVPIDSLMNIVFENISGGRAVCWEGDVTNPGFDAVAGEAHCDEHNFCTQAERDDDFAEGRTTDDHCMALVGMGYDKKGNLFYIAKNSWGTGNRHGGYVYMSDKYLRRNTIAIGVLTDKKIRMTAPLSAKRHSGKTF